MGYWVEDDIISVYFDKGF